MQYAWPIARLIKALSGLPGIGEKTAQRLALFLLNAKKDYIEELVGSIGELGEKVGLCSMCMTFSDKDPCAVCSDASRDERTICVVADFRDMVAIEGAGSYRGRYHVLHGCLAPLKGIGPQDVKIRELMERVASDAVGEVIVATPFDSEGEATAHYIKKVLKPFNNLKLTRIASGIPVGGYIEYMDPSTLGRAMEGRKDI
ncbi:MAG: recombination protein RecR [Deltaproteobacteria bacterium]|nr:recombination protein RecR [Deltaproteobacteria bacterium]